MSDAARRDRVKRQVRSHRPVDRLKARILRTRGDRCLLCDKPEADSIEHVIPVETALGMGWTRAQINAMDNVGLSHLECNKRRGTKSFEAARAEIMTGVKVKLPPPGQYIPNPSGNGFLDSRGSPVSREW